MMTAKAGTMERRVVSVSEDATCFKEALSIRSITNIPKFHILSKLACLVINAGTLRLIFFL